MARLWMMGVPWAAESVHRSPGAWQKGCAPFGVSEPTKPLINDNSHAALCLEDGDQQRLCCQMGCQARQSPLPTLFNRSHATRMAG